MARLYQSKEWLRVQYVFLKRTPKEIAAITGSNEVTIRDWLDKFELLKKRKNK